ncbi:macro domain-containing protein [Catenulispora yoronensis]
MLTPEQLDSAEFAGLVNEALRAAPVAAVRLLERALGMYQGQPMSEAAGEEYAAVPIRRLTRLRDTARQELVRIHLELGAYRRALPLLEDLAAEQPEDAAIAELLATVRARLRRGLSGVIVHRGLPSLHTAVSVVVGDLFEQDGANLVVGFSDTFDVATDRDVVISRESVQGQLVARVFGGDARTLDRELKRALRTVEPLSVESVHDKRVGKRVRYPIGTVAVVPAEGRRVFATAYSELGNDLVARATEDGLRLSLDRLWAAAARHGLDKPLAMPLVGSGLARIVEAEREDLILLIARSYVRAGRAHRPRVAPELRIVLRAGDLERTDLAALEAYLSQVGE